MTLFCGKHESVIDAGGRLTIPRVLRESVGDSVAAMMGTNAKLWLMPGDEFRRRLTAIRSEELLPAHRRAPVMNAMAAMTKILPLDARGRIAISRAIRERTKLSDQVTLLGVGDHIEIWPRELWEQETTGPLKPWDPPDLSS